jgi:hypothetical protein
VNTALPGTQRIVPVNSAMPGFQPINPALSLADLNLESIDVSTNIIDGDTVGSKQEIKLGIANSGDVAVRGVILDVVCRSSNCPASLSATVTIPMLQPGQKVSVLWPPKTTSEKWSAGSYTIAATLRPKDSSVIEKQLFNNSKNFVLTVKQKLSFTPSLGASMQSGTIVAESGGIDLVASDAAVAQTIFATEPVGNPGKVQLTALNKGTADAPGTKMRVTCQRSGATSITNAANTSCPAYLSGITDVPPLKAGATTILNWPPPTPQSWEAGTYQLTFELNYDHKTSELNGYYENNRRSFTLFVWPKKETPSVSRTITPQTIKPLTVVPKIIMQELIPSHWAPGKEYTLNLIGENLTKDILFRLKMGSQ